MNTNYSSQLPNFQLTNKGTQYDACIQSNVSFGILLSSTTICDSLRKQKALNSDRRQISCNNGTFQRIESFQSISRSLLSTQISRPSALGNTDYAIESIGQLLSMPD